MTTLRRETNHPAIIFGMRTTAALVVACAVAGCDTIFGIHVLDDPSADATADGGIAFGDSGDSGDSGDGLDGGPDTTTDGATAVDQSSESLETDADAMTTGDGEAGTGTCFSGVTCSPSTPCRKGVTECDAGHSVCTPQGSLPDGTYCDAGAVCSSGQCMACPGGADCTEAGSCQSASIVCSTGMPICTLGGEVPNGTNCGTNLYCDNGTCLPCTNGAPCVPTGAPCHNGNIVCADGGSTCNDTMTFADAGASCGVNEVCSTNGQCTACTVGQPCNPTSCTQGTTQCSSGSPQCTGVSNLPDDAPCAGGNCCGGSCVNLMQDGSNCGVCGHSCLGGTCSSGQCQPIVLATASDNLETVVVDSTTVYFTDSPGPHVYSCPLSGCPGGVPMTVYTAMGANGPFLGGLVFASGTSDLVVADARDNTVFEISTAGTLNWTSGPTGITQPNGLTADSTNIYSAQYGGIGYVPNIGGTSKQLCALSNELVWRVAYDPTTNSVFGAVRGPSGGYMVQCPVPSGTANTFGPLEPDVYDVRVMGNTVYYVIAGTSPAYANGGLFASPVTALTNRTILAQGSAYGDATALTVDQNNVYFFSGAAREVYRCPVGGCSGAPAGIASVYGITAMTNDASAVYWVQGTTPNQLMKLAK